MSVMRYTFASALLHSETSLVITLPEAPKEKRCPSRLPCYYRMLVGRQIASCVENRWNGLVAR